MPVAPLPMIADRYRVLRTLGQGAFGRTLLARDEESGREVAIKMLGTQKVDSFKGFELLEREAQVLRSVRHHGVPEIYDSLKAQWEGRDAAFLVMESIEGKSLEALIAERHHLDPADASHILLELLGVLDYLHSRVPPQFLNAEGRIAVPATLPGGERQQQVLARMLRPSPTQCYQTAREVRQALLATEPMAVVAARQPLPAPVRAIANTIELPAAPRRVAAGSSSDSSTWARRRSRKSLQSRGSGMNLGAVMAGSASSSRRMANSTGAATRWPRAWPTRGDPVTRSRSCTCPNRTMTGW